MNTGNENSMKKRVVFFIRRFNDIDHFSPLIDRMIELTEFEPLAVCITSNEDLKKNHNISYLVKKNLKVWYLHDILKLSLKSIILSYINILLQKFTVYYYLPVFLDKIRLRFYNRISRLLFEEMIENQDWGAILFKHIEPDALVFDPYSKYSLENMPLLPIINEAKKESVPLFEIPHGMCFYNDVNYYPERDQTPDLDCLDYYIVPNSLESYHRQNGGIPKEKLFELGSLRFCEEWVSKYEKEIIQHLTFKTIKKSKLKVVFMMSDFSYNVFPEMIYNTFKVLAEIQGIDLYVKPHTRSNKVWQFQEAVEDFDLKLAINISSSSLIKWADVVIVFGSSISVQVLYDQKVLIYPSYLDSNQFILDEMSSCWSVKNLKQFKDAMIKLIDKPSYRPYSPKAVDSAIKTLIYANRDDKDVINNYVNFIKGKIY